MKTKLIIDPRSLLDWQQHHYVLYASVFVENKNKLLRLWVSTNSIYKVEFGDELLYCGDNCGLAIYTFNGMQ